MLGTPLLLSEGCDIAAEAVEAGCAIVVDFDDNRRAAAMIDDLLRDSSAQRRRAMGARAVVWARERFSTEQVARSTVDLYAELLATVRSAARRSTTSSR